MCRAQELEKHLQRPGWNRLIGVQHEGDDMLVMTVHAMMMMGVIVGIGFGGEPFPDVGNFQLWVIQAATQQTIGSRFAFGGVKYRRGGIERMQTSDHAGALYGVSEIGFCQYDAVGHRRLLHRFGMRIERRLSIHAIDYRHYAI